MLQAYDRFLRHVAESSHLAFTDFEAVHARVARPAPAAA
jgi:hypothetical protein